MNVIPSRNNRFRVHRVCCCLKRFSVLSKHMLVYSDAETNANEYKQYRFWSENMFFFNRISVIHQLCRFNFYFQMCLNNIKHNSSCIGKHFFLKYDLWGYMTPFFFAFDPCDPSHIINSCVFRFTLYKPFTV